MKATLELAGLGPCVPESHFTISFIQSSVTKVNSGLVIVTHDVFPSIESLSQFGVSEIVEERKTTYYQYDRQDSRHGISIFLHFTVNLNFDLARNKILLI